MMSWSSAETGLGGCVSGCCYYGRWGVYGQCYKKGILINLIGWDFAYCDIVSHDTLAKHFLKIHTIQFP